MWMPLKKTIFWLAPGIFRCCYCSVSGIPKAFLKFICFSLYNILCNIPFEFRTSMISIVLNESKKEDLYFVELKKLYFYLFSHI
jgi:hypothetical protein